MAKLRLPLLSLEARGALGESIVFFPWKGINVARQYVVPSNPQTDAQNTQRGYVIDAVDRIHDAIADAVMPLATLDTVAYALYSRTLGRVMTWFNAACKQFVDQRVAALFGCIYKGALLIPGAGQVFIQLDPLEDEDSANAVTAGNWHYGTSPTALLSTWPATFIGGVPQDTITPLTAGVKYYFQFRPTLHADFVGTRSGIYYATPT